MVLWPLVGSLAMALAFMEAVCMQYLSMCEYVLFTRISFSLPFVVKIVIWFSESYMISNSCKSG